MISACHKEQCITGKRWNPDLHPTHPCLGKMSMCIHRGLSPEPTYWTLDVTSVLLCLFPLVCADSYTLVFHDPMDACKFCLQVQAAAGVQGGREGCMQARAGGIQQGRRKEEGRAIGRWEEVREARESQGERLTNVSMPCSPPATAVAIHEDNLRAMSCSVFSCAHLAGHPCCAALRLTALPGCCPTPPPGTAIAGEAGVAGGPAQQGFTT